MTAPRCAPYPRAKVTVEGEQPVLRQWVALALVVVGAALFVHYDLLHYLRFGALKSGYAQLLAAYHAHPLTFIAAFMGIEIVGLALCIPGVVLTISLAGGAIFGVGPGSLIVLTAMTVGDSLGFLAARYLVGDWVRPMVAGRLKGLDEEMAKSGGLYLLSLRLIAAIPYFVINLAFGLTRMPLRVFAPVSFIGLAPATILYVNAGTQLAKIERPSDALSPSLIVTLGLMSLLPLAARYAFARKARAR